MAETFMGLDFSTQQVKIITLNSDLNVLNEVNVNFDVDLPEYKTKGGVHIHDDELTVTAPSAMWIAALDKAMQKLKNSGFDFKSVAAVSGTGQQHGSVYWKHGSKDLLHNLRPQLTLFEQLKTSFSIEASPIWMDSSTEEQCKILEKHLGGGLALSNLTGSRAYERFTGNQIMKVFHSKRKCYDETERISLVSSFAATLLLGDYAAIDNSDGSGMNMLDIKNKCWSKACMDAIADETLLGKLGDPVPSSTNLGNISSYFVQRYGFHENCKVIAFTGDNPASLAGCRLQKGDIVVSLGTSDTLMIWLDEPKPALEGHVFVNPVDDDAYMALLCFKNGSLTRERMRNRYADCSWDNFSKALRETKPGNEGKVGFFFDVREITPNAVGEYHFDADDNSVVGHFEPESEIRCVVESQFLSKRYYAEKLGYKLSSSSRVLATGGASNNQEILQVLSDVFNSNVYTLDVANSACLGCAYRAKQGLDGINFNDVFSSPPNYKLAAVPSGYQYDVSRYGLLEEKAINSSLT